MVFSIEMVTFKYDLWSSSYPARESDQIEVHCLFPNGIYSPFRVKQNISIYELKEVSLQMNHAIMKGREKHKNKIKCVIDFVFSLLSHYCFSNLFLEFIQLRA